MTATDSSQVTGRRTTLSRAYRDGLAEEMARDPSILVMGTDLYERGGHWAQVTGLGPEFGRDRVRNTPISEAAMVAAGVGAALDGLRPVVDLNFADFAFGAMDEIVNQAAKVRYWWNRPVPLVIRGTTGFAGGGAQHNNSLEAWFCHVPGLLVAMPSTPADAKGLIKTALRGADPVIFLMHKMLTGLRGEAGGPDDLVPFGQATIRRPGADVTVATYGVMAGKALRAAESLAADGIDVEVIDMRTLMPLDLDTVQQSARRTRRLVVATEAYRHGGVGGEIAAAMSESLFGELAAPVLRVGAGFAPGAAQPGPARRAHAGGRRHRAVGTGRDAGGRGRVTMSLPDLPLDELRRYQNRRSRPVDAPEFWAGTLADAARYPVAATFEPADSGLRLVDTFDVCFAGYGGHPVRGWLHLPAGQASPLPCVVQYVGYGGGRGLAHENVFWAVAGYAHFIMDTRGQGAAGSVGDTPDPEPAGPVPSRLHDPRHPRPGHLLLPAALRRCGAGGRRRALQRPDRCGPGRRGRRQPGRRAGPGGRRAARRPGRRDG